MTIAYLRVSTGKQHLENQKEEIEKLEKLGVTCFGENRVQAFLEKYENYHGNGEFQFIGTLQPNKVKYIIDKVTLIHAVDRYSLLKEIEKQAAKRDLEMPVLIQVISSLRYEYQVHVINH